MRIPGRLKGCPILWSFSCEHAPLCSGDRLARSRNFIAPPGWFKRFSSLSFGRTILQASLMAFVSAIASSFSEPLLFWVSTLFDIYHFILTL